MQQTFSKPEKLKTNHDSRVEQISHTDKSTSFFTNSPTEIPRPNRNGPKVRRQKSRGPRTGRLTSWEKKKVGHKPGGYASGIYNENRERVRGFREGQQQRDQKVNWAQ